MTLLFCSCGPIAPEDWAPSLSMILLGLGGSTTNPTSLKPGQVVNFNGGQGNVTGTVVDINGDGIADGIALGPANSGITPSNSRPILILMNSGEGESPDGMDVNGDGNIDYFIFIKNEGNITLSAQPNGSGNQITVVLGQGFDTNGDGAIDNPILKQLASDTISPVSTITPAGGTYTSSQNITILCSDNIAPGHIVYTKNGTTPNYRPINGIIKNPPTTSFTVGAEGDGTYTIRYLCRDLVGNLESLHTETYVIDGNVPSVTASLASIYVSNSSGAIDSSQLTWSSNVNGSYSLRSGGTNCTDGTELSNGNIIAAIPDTSTILNAGSLALGNTTIRVCVTSTNNGLVGSYALIITRDDTPPTVTASPTSGSYISLVSVSLTCNDTGGAGCDKIAYSSGTGSAPTDPAITGTTGNITSGNLYSSSIATADLTTTYVKYIARDQAGNTTVVGNESYTVETTPSIPTQVSVLGVGTEIFVQWAPVSNATEYRVYYSTTSPVTISSASITGITNTYHKITSLITDTMYYVRVEAMNSLGAVSQLSQEQTVYTTTTPPGAVVSGSYVDVSAGYGGSAQEISGLIDPISNKLLFITSDGLNNGNPSLYRCNIDGSSCIRTDISAGQGNGSYYIFPFIDLLSNKLLVVVRNGANNLRPSLFRCNLDGTGCTHTDISAGQGINSGMAVSAVIDSISNKLLVVTQNGTNNNKLSLFRCNLDGSNCTHVDISTGQGINSGKEPFSLIDYTSNKLLVVTQNGANSNKLSLFRCNLDGSNCTHADISVGQGTDSGIAPTAVIDSISGKLLVVTQNSNINGHPGLFRCNLDGSGCTHTDISAGQGMNSGALPSLVIDLVSNKLLAVTQNVASNSTPSLFRCDLDGSNCTHTDLSAGQGIDSGTSPYALINPITGKLFVLTQNGANGTKPGLFIW